MVYNMIIKQLINFNNKHSFYLHICPVDYDYTKFETCNEFSQLQLVQSFSLFPYFEAVITMNKTNDADGKHYCTFEFINEKNETMVYLSNLVAVGGANQIQSAGLFGFVIVSTVTIYNVLINLNKKL